MRRVPAPEYGYHARTVRLMELRDDTLLVVRVADGLATPDTPVGELPLGAVTQLEARQDRGSYVGEGAAVGVVAGAMIGAVIGAATYEECVPRQHWLDCLFAPKSAGEQAMLAAVVGRPLGAGVGAIVGAAISKYGWVAVRERTLRVTLAPHRGGASFGVRLAFWRAVVAGTGANPAVAKSRSRPRASRIAAGT